MITDFTQAEIVQDGLDLLVVCDNEVALLAVLEVMGELSPEATAAIWAAVPRNKYEQLQQWAIALLLDSSILDGQLFDNGLTSIQRVLKAFKVLPPNFKKAIWVSIPEQRQEQLRLAA